MNALFIVRTIPVHTFIFFTWYAWLKILRFSMRTNAFSNYTSFFLLHSLILHRFHIAGAFLIPYFICLFCMGIPLFLAETTIGQFSCGYENCWRFFPMLRGIGVLFFIVNAYITVYYVIIIGWGMLYLFHSLRTDLPWSSCEESWECECNSDL